MKWMRIRSFVCHNIDLTGSGKEEVGHFHGIVAKFIRVVVQVVIILSPLQLISNCGELLLVLILVLLLTLLLVCLLAFSNYAVLDNLSGDSHH